MWLVAGSIVERVEGDDKLRNTSVLIGPDGGVHAVYRKIHLFDVEVGGMVYRESDAEAPGDEVVVADADGVELGMAVCYDLRFPELFRIMAVRGARVVSLPAAFTVPTGPRALGDPRAGARDREPGVRDRGGADREHIRPITKATAIR